MGGINSKTEPLPSIVPGFPREIDSSAVPAVSAPTSDGISAGSAMGQDAASLTAGKQSALSLLDPMFDEASDLLGGLVDLVSLPFAEMPGTGAEGQVVASSAGEPSYDSLKAKFLREGALSMADFDVLGAQLKGSKEPEKLVELHDLSLAKDEFQLYGELPDGFAGRVAELAKSKDPDFSRVAEELLSSLEAQASNPAIQPSYDKFKARFLRDGMLSSVDLEKMDAYASGTDLAEQDKLYDLSDLASLKDGYKKYEEISPYNQGILAQLAASSDPEISSAAKNMTVKMASDAQRPHFEFTAPLPPKAAPRYTDPSRQDDQDDHQKDLVVSNLASDPQVMEALRNFSSLSISDKLDLAQTIVNKQAAIYGFQPEPIVYDPQLGEGILGVHRSLSHDIALNLGALRSPEQLINTVTHENAHAYQSQLSDALVNGTLPTTDPLYQTALQWTRNIHAYKNPPELEKPLSPEEAQAMSRAYMEQPIERHAYDTGNHIAAEVKKRMRD